ncbi:unnamed protein product [Arabis nemorensis]|uniref:Uncharacterized protein n=1 Tax=Arabis nemorensis TaxID=586526 RepID=A0A565CB74_9BRAS|nr:unnamed protein product [Arabis nemorensis]
MCMSNLILHHRVSSGLHRRLCTDGQEKATPFETFSSEAFSPSLLKTTLTPQITCSNTTAPCFSERSPPISPVASLSKNHSSPPLGSSSQKAGFRRDDLHDHLVPSELLLPPGPPNSSSFPV